MYNQNTNTSKKAKEHALSLLRIPLNFFEEDSKKTEVNNPNNDELKISTNSSAKTSKKNDIKLDANNPTAHIDISKEIELQQTSSNNKAKQDDNTQQPLPPDTNYTNAQHSSSKTSTTSIPSSSQPQVEPAPRPSTKPQTGPSTPQPTATTVANSPAPLPTSQPINIETPKPTNDTTHEHIPSETESDHASHNNATPSNIPNEPSQSYPHPSPTDTPNAGDSNKKIENTAPSTNSLPSDDLKKQKVDELKNKFSKTPAGQKLNAAKDNVKTKIADKVLNNPTASKALGTLKDAKKTADTAKDAINNLDADKMQEAVGDVAFKVASKAGDAVTPGLGKAIEVVNKTIGQTKIGKKSKKVIGGCFCAIGCIVPMIILLFPIIIMIQGFSWATNLFSRDNSIYGELTEEQYALIKEASTLYSMQEYTDLTMQLNDPGFIDWFLNGKSDAPIQDALEKYINEHYTFSAEDVIDYNNKYGDLVEKNYLMPIAEGDMTSFGTAFEILLKNYSIFNLKAPASAPKRIKTVNGKEVVYTTYDPTGIHQALFEDVLNNVEGLKSRFDGQVRKEWFEELESILDKPCPIYLENFDHPDSINNPPKRTLRELLAETSRQANDTEYYAILVNNALTKYTTTNAEIITQYNELTKRLAMLEVMTYMLSYQKYYSQMEVFNNSIKNSKYLNKDMFNAEFFSQFLTFSNVEYYLALSNLADHSLTYEIAVASIEGSINNIETVELKAGNNYYLGIEKFDNWFATYYLNPEIIQSSDNDISFAMSPTMTKTQTQQFLFDKYNVEADIFENEERTAAQNQNSFFGAFELATGLDMAIMDDFGNAQTPLYYLNSDGVISSTISYLSGSSSVPTFTAENKAFPVGDAQNVRVSQGFGYAYSDATCIKTGKPLGTVHMAIDYAIPTGSDLFAVSSGIAYVYPATGSYGYNIKIKHDDGHMSVYAHGNGVFYVENGQRVTAGQPIMQSGNSGTSTGPHLHFEVRDPSGNKINPNTYITTNT